MKVTVLGDPLCDHNLYRGLRDTPDSSEVRGLWTKPTGGGVLLLQDLLKATLSKSSSCDVHGIIADPAVLSAALPGHYHSYCLWEPQISDLQEKDETRKKREVWRAAEPPLGYGRKSGAPAAPFTHPNSKDARILVLDDAGLDFRNKPLQIGKPDWIILKLTGSIGDGELWKSLVAAKPANLVIILSADQLRRADIRLSRALSWEATAQDLQRELESNPSLAPLQLARHLIVNFRSDGAFWMSRPPADDARSMLVFDATRAEGDWRSETGPGIVFGYLSCFTAAIVHLLCHWTPPAAPDPAAPPAEPDFEAALSAGLGATRTLHRTGHGHIEIKDPADAAKSIPNPDPGFPFAEIAAAIQNPAEKFASTVLPASTTDTGDWMMLDEWHVHSAEASFRRPYYQAAFAAAILGPDALERFPVARFGSLRTVDRGEIEGLRIVRQAMQDYRDGGPQKKPLNIGVFGPPGAGKSFGVGEIVKAVFGQDARLLTFNLSQFSDPAMLHGAFHQIRDKVIAGETPVAFWDEFDSESYKWLQYLLAPMNDGVFQDGPLIHPLGKCVCIFAGATSASFDTFGPVNPDDPDILQDPDHPDHKALNELEGEAREHADKAWRDFVLKKGPDFKSRLVATLDVLGPNPRLLYPLDSATGDRRPQPDPTDRCCPIRRAFFIRSRFRLHGTKETKRLDIDHGLLRALLEIPRYRSGSRSLEFLCDHLRQQAGQATVRRSHLPGDPLLARHAHLKPFAALCESDTYFLPVAEPLAPGFHEDWLKLAASDNPANKPWDQLDAAYRKSNTEQALRIPRNLALIGLHIERQPFRPGEETAAQALIEKHIEVLAESEHNGWMVERMLAGWRYANIQKKNDKDKLHPLLLPYVQLSEAQKEKDRRPIKGYTPAAGSAEEPVTGYIQRLQQAGCRAVLTNATP